MTVTYDFSMTFKFEPPKEILDVPRWLKAVKDSTDEFAEELNDWLEKHPLIEGAKMKGTVS